MNLKLRFENPWSLVAILICAVLLVYEVLALLGIVPFVVENDKTEGGLEVFSMIVTALLGAGAAVDPTTSGLSDSSRARKYSEPFNDIDNLYNGVDVAMNEGDGDEQDC